MKYNIRLICLHALDDVWVEQMEKDGKLAIVRRFDGMNGIDTIFDVKCAVEGLDLIVNVFKLVYFPLNHYDEFKITCPNCGNTIEDDMILKAYDENVLSGYTINCTHDDCGCQMANVDWISEHNIENR